MGASISSTNSDHDRYTLYHKAFTGPKRGRDELDDNKRVCSKHTLKWNLVSSKGEKNIYEITGDTDYYLNELTLLVGSPWLKKVSPNQNASITITVEKNGKQETKLLDFLQQKEIHIAFPHENISVDPCLFESYIDSPFLHLKGDSKLNEMKYEMDVVSNPYDDEKSGKRAR